MITFLICLALLVGAYFTYGRFLERLAGADERAATPCRRLYDGVDYVPLPRWRVFLIQLLNIAGTGPIFGAVLGACFGPVAFLWITLGGIFMGAMHDYLSGMMLVRHDGLSIPEVAGRYLGGGMRRFMRLFSVALLVLVGAVFLLSPAQLLGELVPAVPVAGWVWIILAYYFVATLLPIDRLIGRVYPLFGVALVAMALGLLGAVVAGPWRIPELTTLSNFQLRAAELPIVPTLFITVACGAISGFHATQSPLMARCVGDERACRPVFYGAMISESIIALVWAAVAMAFFGGAGELSTALSAHGDSAAWAVGEISHGMLGLVGGALALLGVVAAPVTSGDTAFRSARLIVADMLRLDQRSKLRRLAVSLPLLAAGYLLTRVDFGVVWRYFAWTNQTLAVVVLWAIVVYLVQRGAPVRVALWPALFMTFVCASFVFVSDQFLGMECRPAAYALGGAATLAVWLLFRSKIRRDAKGNA
ncbi:carbon starvation protein A [Alistipes sp.]|uniref:carbon starvation CstA family protein n=1 Tax=Alistipes sp. TaxID=1872444 RepID=UPI000EE1076B|nr:carbon starvation CstA family protein [Alistipes sp.]HCN14380.1 carbon starvation protein A [Alistipes sp.]